ncbi:MAG: hypothetical protein SGI73_04005 [Chloroflexota bacterium]|nr:hypothetical protein [Chloroflexota bacterium]
MGRVINTDSTGKNRNQMLRSIAELLRRLTQKTEIDNEARDMMAALILCLKEIEDGIEQSADVWDKRGYYMKADELRMRYDWVNRIAVELERILFAASWDALPALLVKLLTYVSDIKVTKLTRKDDLWDGKYDELIRLRSPEA